jgi:hypothetical protein
MQLGQTGDPIRHPAAAEHHPGLVQHAHLVVGFGPVQADNDHPASSPAPPWRAEEARSDLMDQCSRHPIPPAVSLLTDQQGTL